MPILIAFLWIGLGLLCQLFIFGHLTLAGGMVLSYLYMAVRMPVEWNRMWQIVIGFGIGMIVDSFTNTPGLHALACATTMWLRLPLLHMFVVVDDIKNGCPTYHRLGFSVFSRWFLILLSVHSIVLYTAEAFTLFNFWHLLSKVLFTIILTFIVLTSAEVANNTK